MNYNVTPPNRTKYNFGSLEPTQQMEYDGDYKLVSVAAKKYSERHGIEILVMKGAKNKPLTIYRKK